jgi:uncharacterized membrane protein
VTPFILYIITFVTFLGIDFFGLSYVIKPIFDKEVGHLMTDKPRLGPAFLFYAFFIAGVIYFASWPAIQNDRSLMWVFLTAAFLGAMSYGTYEFTNLATLKDWSWTLVITDLTWGTLLTGTSAALGVAALRTFT